MEDLEAKLKAAQEEITRLRRKKGSFTISRGRNIAKSQRKRTSRARRQDDDEQRPPFTWYNKPYRQSMKGE